MINKINNFFFPLEEEEQENLSTSDVLWFYGILVGAIALVTFVVISTW